MLYLKHWIYFLTTLLAAVTLNPPTVVLSKEKAVVCYVDRATEWAWGGRAAATAQWREWVHIPLFSSVILDS